MLVFSHLNWSLSIIRRYHHIIKLLLYPLHPIVDVLKRLLLRWFVVGDLCVYGGALTYVLTSVCVYLVLVIPHLVQGAGDVLLHVQLK